MSEHSNLPWRAAKGGFIMAPDEGREVQIGKIGDFSDRELLPFNKKRWQADIELIVKAVNNYDHLVVEVERLRNELEVAKAVHRLCCKEVGPDRAALADAFAKKFPAILSQYSQFKIVDWFLQPSAVGGPG